MNLSGLHLLWYVRNVSGEVKKGKNNNRTGCYVGIRRKIKNNDAAGQQTALNVNQDEAARHKQSAHWEHGKHRKFMCVT